MQETARNEALMDAVAFYDVQAVRDCLEAGADSNYTQSPDEPGGLLQPTTPLRLVLFRISDNLLEDHHLEKFAQIAKLLLQYGADPEPALQIAEARYGKYDPHAAPGPFMDVWRIVAEAADGTSNH